MTARDHEMLMMMTRTCNRDRTHKHARVSPPEVPIVSLRGAGGIATREKAKKQIEEGELSGFFARGLVGLVRFASE